MVFKITWLRLLIILVLFLSTTFEFRVPYYEARGIIMIESLGIRISYTWPAKGFDRRYCGQFGICCVRTDYFYPESYQR